MRRVWSVRRGRKTRYSTPPVERKTEPSGLPMMVSWGMAPLWEWYSLPGWRVMVLMRPLGSVS
ncbi:hypothetical protein BJF79_21065 [Actinomadura sp. CNU-125]|nr:hypothetical protein BJF79_21065 [Actinomadura sp. CNU-125]